MLGPRREGGGHGCFKPGQEPVGSKVQRPHSLNVSVVQDKPLLLKSHFWALGPGPNNKVTGTGSVLTAFTWSVDAKVKSGVYIYIHTHMPAVYGRSWARESNHPQALSSLFLAAATQPFYSLDHTRTSPSGSR